MAKVRLVPWPWGKFMVYVFSGEKWHKKTTLYPKDALFLKMCAKDMSNSKVNAYISTFRSKAIDKAKEKCKTSTSPF